MTTDTLSVYLFDEFAGRLTKTKGGKLTFTYLPEYLINKYAIPLSMSMPLLFPEHKHETISPWLWGLLPDNEWVIQQWARRFQVSANDIFGLIKGVGEDCAGAVRFSENEDALPFPGGKKVLTSKQIEKRISNLQKDPSLGRELEDRGQFSLAGAQTKTALQKTGKKWYITWGDEPTTHILKLAHPNMDGHVENEHYCLKLADHIGLNTATSEVLKFGAQKVISVERFDRFHGLNQWRRMHQEDGCQALLVHPSKKYQSEGGPNIANIMTLLNRCSNAVKDREQFIDYIVFNYLIMGSDAHAKNYTIRLAPQGLSELAPLYDVASLLPYLKRNIEARFAMKYGGHYKDSQIQIRHFEKLAKECHYPTQSILKQLTQMAERIIEAAPRVGESLEKQGITHPIIKILKTKLVKRSKDVLKSYREHSQ